MSPIPIDSKANAFSFLETLQHRFNAELPAVDQLRSIVRSTTQSAKQEPNREHLRSPESAFVKQFVLPRVFDLMQTVDGIDKEKARRALLCEGYARLPEYSSGTPARTQLHPFTKVIAASAPDIFQRWKEQTRAFTQACPDLAFQEPFPFKVVFECKYFERGSLDKAARDLVTAIYQAFFYRSLPYIPPKGAGPAWDYDFGCLLACDASAAGNLLKAWIELPSEVKAGFWDGANVYVMIIRPTDRGN